MITVKKARLCYVLLGILLGCSCSDVSRDEAAEMDRFVTELMGKMTLHEKLGQLNLPSGGDMVTGTVMNGELSEFLMESHFPHKLRHKTIHLCRLIAADIRT